MWTAIAASVIAVVLALTRAVPGLATLEGIATDLRFRVRGERAPATDRIVIVGLDDATRERHPELMQTRRGYARLVDALTACKPKLIALDLFFTSREELLPRELVERIKAATATPCTGDDCALHALLVAIADQLRGDDELAAAIARSKLVMLGAFFQQGPAVAGEPEPIGLTLARAGQVADGGGGDVDLRPITATSVA